MSDSLEDLYVRPRSILESSRVNVFDAVNMVVYAKVPLISARQGRQLVAAYVQSSWSGLDILPASQVESGGILERYSRDIDSLRYPVAPSQYQPLLLKMVAGGESTLPFFFHEHHELVNRRRRAALFRKLYAELMELVSKNELTVQLTESEKTTLITSASWMSGKTFHGYLDRYGVCPWWENQSNLSLHSIMERLLLSDTNNVAEDGWSEPYDTEQLPSLIFGRMLLERTPRGLARVGAPVAQVENPKDQQGHKQLAEAPRQQEECAVPEARDEATEETSSPTEAVRLKPSVIKRVLQEEEVRPPVDDNEKGSRIRSTDANSEITLAKKDVAELLRVSVSTVDNYRSRPDFPEPLRLNGPTIRWRRDDILAWLDQCSRDKGSGAKKKNADD